MTLAAALWSLAAQVAVVSTLVLWTYKPFIEARTGMLFGTYRWFAESTGKPKPLFHLVINHPGTDMVRIECGVNGHTVFITWGHKP